jgi:hypothetical protein
MMDYKPSNQKQLPSNPMPKKKPAFAASKNKYKKKSRENNTAG